MTQNALAQPGSSVGGAYVEVVEPAGVGDTVQPLGVWGGLALDAEAFRPAQHDVVAPVGKPLVIGDEPGASDGVDRRVAPHLLARVRKHRDHADQSLGFEGGLGHLPVAGLEDVERGQAAREENDVRERE